MVADSGEGIQRGACVEGVLAEGAEAGREVREKAGLGRPIQQPEETITSRSIRAKSARRARGLEPRPAGW